MSGRDRLSRRGLLAAAASSPRLAWTQAPPRRRRLALLTAQWASAHEQTLPAFAEALRALGWLAGRDYVLETFFSEGDYKRLSELAQSMAADPPEIVLTAHNAATARAQRALPASTAILMVSSLDPVSAGFVASLARPGRNITGLTWAPPEAIGKQVEIASLLVPAARRLLVLTQSSRESMAQADHARPAAGQHKLELLPVVADTLEALAQRLPVPAKGRRVPTVAVVAAMAAFFSFRQQLHQLLQQRGVPAVYSQREHALVGGMASYGPSIVGNWRQAARLVDRILRGARPAELPVEQPGTYELVLNRTTIRAQNLNLPASLLQRATEVID